MAAPEEIVQIRTDPKTSRRLEAFAPRIGVFRQAINPPPRGVCVA